MIGAQIVVALQTVVARQVSPLEPAVVTVGEFHAGSARNVIADQAYFGGTVRYFHPDLAPVLPQKLEAIVAGICHAYGARYEWSYEYLYPPLVNDPAMAELVRSVAQQVVEPDLGWCRIVKPWGAKIWLFSCRRCRGAISFWGRLILLKDWTFPTTIPALTLMKRCSVWA